jgi:hypothetical protein
MCLRFSTAVLDSAPVTLVVSIDVTKCIIHVKTFVWVKYIAGMNIPWAACGPPPKKTNAT